MGKAGRDAIDALGGLMINSVKFAAGFTHQSASLLYKSAFKRNPGGIDSRHITGHKMRPWLVGAGATAAAMSGFDSGNQIVRQADVQTSENTLIHQGGVHKMVDDMGTGNLGQSLYQNNMRR